MSLGGLRERFAPAMAVKTLVAKRGFLTACNMYDIVGFPSIVLYKCYVQPYLCTPGLLCATLSLFRLKWQLAHLAQGMTEPYTEAGPVAR